MNFDLKSPLNVRSIVPIPKQSKDNIANGSSVPSSAGSTPKSSVLTPTNSFHIANSTKTSTVVMSGTNDSAHRRNNTPVSLPPRPPTHPPNQNPKLNSEKDDLQFPSIDKNTKRTTSQQKLTHPSSTNTPTKPSGSTIRDGMFQRSMILAAASGNNNNSNSNNSNRTASSSKSNRTSSGSNNNSTNKEARTSSKKSRTASSKNAASKEHKEVVLPGDQSLIVSTASLVDQFWPCRDFGSEIKKFVSTSSGEALLDNICSKLGVSLTPPLDISINNNNNQIFIPQFLARPQFLLGKDVLPTDIDCLWLSDSPFNYRTASLVFHPCDLAPLPDGRKETKEKNQDETRPVIIPPPLRRYWKESRTLSPLHNEDNEKLSRVNDDLIISPAIHSQLLNKIENNNNADPVLFRTVQDLLLTTGDDRHKIVQPCYFGLQRRVKRQGPNLGNITFFYSSSAAKSSPALSVIRAAGMAEDTSATAENVKACGWTLWWAKGVTSAHMACMDPGQKVNHFPGTWALGRKDNLNKHLMVQFRKFGHQHYGFFPKGYLLPKDRPRLKHDMAIEKKRAKEEWKQFQIHEAIAEKQRDAENKHRKELEDRFLVAAKSSGGDEASAKKRQQEFLDELTAAGVEIPGLNAPSTTAGQNINGNSTVKFLQEKQRQQQLLAPRKIPLYIFKRVAGACGRGMKVITRMPPGSWGTALVQEYIDRPLLVNGFKFDLRIYVAVTSFNPLRCYVYREGLARFATSKYPTGQNANANDRTAHLTNFSVNRNNVVALKKKNSIVVSNKKQQDQNAVNIDCSASVKLQPTSNENNTRILEKTSTVRNCTSKLKKGDSDDDEDEEGDDDDEDDNDEEGDADDDDEEEIDNDNNDDEEFFDEDDTENDDDDGDGGNAVPKWTFEMLHHWFRENLPPSSWDLAWSRIDDVIVKTLLAAENTVTTTMRSIRPRERFPTCFFELFGFDVLLKADLNPVLMEVNIMCSLESRCSPLDQYVKGNMLADCLSLVGVVPLGRENKFATPDPLLMAPSLHQLKKVCQCILQHVNNNNNNKNNDCPSSLSSVLSSEDVLKEILANSSLKSQGIVTEPKNESELSASDSVDDKIKFFHLHVNQFWQTIASQNPMLVDVIVYSEEERFRKGETFRRAYPPELHHNQQQQDCSTEKINCNKPGYFTENYSQFYQEIRASDAALSKWYELQCKAVELMKCLVSNSATRQVNADVLLLCIDVKQLSGRFFLGPSK